MRPTLLLIVLLAAGCDPMPPSPLLGRIELERRFQTHEVFQAQYPHDSNYVVRDTNGAIWYVLRRSSSNYATKIFEANK